jgi:phage protein D
MVQVSYAAATFPLRKRSSPMTKQGPARLFFACALLAGGAAAGTGAEIARVALRVSIGGSPLPEGSRHQVVVEQDLDQPDMASFTLTGRKGLEFAGGVDLGDDASVETGPDSPQGLFKGEVVSIEPFVVSGESRVTIRAFNRLHRLTHERKTRVFLEKTDAEIVEIVAVENGLVPAPSSDLSERYASVYQHNQTDLEFLLERAARIGYEVLVDDTKLVFRKREVASPLVLAKGLRAGDSRLQRFHARLSTSNTVQRVVVHGFDPQGQEHLGEATAPTLLLVPGDPAPDLVLGRTIEFTIDQPIFSPEEARAIANSKLEEATLSYVTGEAEAKGHPKIKAGILVEIAGAGDRFDGQYSVAGVRHRYSHLLGCAGGYKSRLKVRRRPIALFFLPEVDDEVLVAFVHGDLSRPFVVGSLWDDDADCRDRPPAP